MSTRPAIRGAVVTPIAFPDPPLLNANGVHQRWALRSIIELRAGGELVGLGGGAPVVLRLDPDLLELPEERRAWVPEGCVGYSKICTHAGCPVGLYRAEAHELLCPCHQSTFDVLRGAVPTFGPADRPLPQLPMGLDDEGYLIALSDYREPVGPGFWNLDRGGG